MSLPGEREFIKCLKLPPAKPVKLTFKADTEITDVIGWIASITCKGFIVQSGINLGGRKVTVFAPSEVTAAELYRLFLSLLESVQLTVEPEGRFLRIIEAGKAARARLPLYPAGTAPERDDGYVTRLVRLKHADVAEIAGLLQGYRGEQGSIAAYPPAGTLIITDRVGTIERLMAMVAELDVPGEALRLWAVPVHHLGAADMAATLTDLMGLPASVKAGSHKTVVAPSGPGAPPSTGSSSPASGVARILPDERAGRLLVVATEQAFARLASLAKQLDVPADTRASQVHTYRCRHADCDAVAAILASLTGVHVSRGPATEARTRTSVPGVGMAGPAPTTGAGSAAASGGGSAAAGGIFASEVRITSDPTTNALLVLSSLDDFRTLRRLVDEIDVPRKQVFIEATIMEVLERKDRTIGVGYHAGINLGEGLGVGGFDAGKTLLMNKETLGAALVGLSGLAVGAPLDGVAQALGLPAGSLPSLGAFIQLLQRDDNINLVANPHLLITNNHEGQISVGQVIPVQASFVATAGAGVPNSGGIIPTVGVNREPVALTLTLRPHVNDENLIRLEIDQEMSELASATFSPLGPSTTKRTAQTTVFARDQQTIIIGGLMRDKVGEGSQKVPLLGDIPVLGFLFRSKQKTVEKQNIILAITPYVINDPADLVRILQAKIRDRRDFLRHFGTDHERRLLEGPLGRPPSAGMVEQINRAVKHLDAQAPSPALAHDLDSPN
jgi:general secretion pathway protein D